MYRVSISKAVSKQIESLPSDTALKLVRKLMDLAGNPRPSGCVKLIGEENSGAFDKETFVLSMRLTTIPER